MVKLNQKNIFGYTHYAKEIYQQFLFVSGARPVPERLRPFLNVPSNWVAPPEAELSHFHALFSDTDVFVVEVSSIREVVFKSILLQINRVQELLASDPAVLANWWKPMLRTGVNDVSAYPLDKVTPVDAEVVNSLVIREQTTDQLESDIRRIMTFLDKPIVFVSHFDTDYDRTSIPQRRMIIDTLGRVCRRRGVHVFDPTSEVLDAGLDVAITDLGHYKPSFEPRIAECMEQCIQKVLMPKEPVAMRA
ncbi:hypothetical protein J5J86_15840 [Aquabacter sp. L1I39]|uniref:hypothetical protein n=1 Tax=Aquabacter sp. L1I39 TaxID=2820278 RepID=UPI001ADBF365|nr:hypothetical protein [Aquabacter sp. L1I39]QTL02261.1 hypothetical protein J5J86_15840 [Aquabacter sp. L1I39]